MEGYWFVIVVEFGVGVGFWDVDGMWFYIVLG